MELLRINPENYRRMPWKNGGGITTELIIEPSGSTLDSGFLWRLSMAQVNASGPFSPFVGYDRTLLLLDGEGMILDQGEHGIVRVEHTLEPVTFPGEWSTYGTLLGGPCRDFNVISRHDSIRHEVHVLRFTERSMMLPLASTTLLFCVAGSLHTENIEGSTVNLEPLELLRIDRPPGGQRRDVTRTVGPRPFGAVCFAAGPILPSLCSGRMVASRTSRRSTLAQDKETLRVSSHADHSVAILCLLRDE